MRKALIIIMTIITLIMTMMGCASSDSSSSGTYGRGSKYDSDVNYAADAFGESSDRVNDVYSALGDAMR